MLMVWLGGASQIADKSEREIRITLIALLHGHPSHLPRYVGMYVHMYVWMYVPMYSCVYFPQLRPAHETYTHLFLLVFCLMISRQLLPQVRHTPTRRHTQDTASGLLIILFQYFR